MKQYDPYKVINEFTQTSRHIFSDCLTGVYLHGSIAMNCFNPEKSDIDLIIVIENSIMDTQKLNFMNRIVELNKKAPEKGLEMSIIKREYCKPFVYPTPYELHFSPMHLKWFNDDPQGYVSGMNGTDKDLAAHFTIIRHYGITVYGAEIPEVFGEVPAQDYIDSIWCDVKNACEDIHNDPVYITLNLCRAAAYIEDGLCLSKKQGGEWYLANCGAGDEFSIFVRLALNCYAGGRVMEYKRETAAAFADKLIAICQKALTDRK